MTGSRFRLLAWCLPVLVAGGMWARLHVMRTETKEFVSASPEPVILVPLPPPVASAPRATDEARVYDRLRRELAQLRTRIATRERQLRAVVATPILTPKPLNLSEDFLPAADWRDAGADTPAALAETILWAGAGGDVQRMANLLAFDEDGLAAAKVLLSRLPTELRPTDADGRELMALLSTDAVPLTTAKLVGNFPTDTGEHVLVLRLTPAENAPAGERSRNVRLTARQDTATALWRLVVPPSAVDRFARTLGLDPVPTP
jgi:hypothetical protein